jgi:hypothetical protein
MTRERVCLIAAGICSVGALERAFSLDWKCFLLIGGAYGWLLAWDDARQRRGRDA